MSSAKIIPFRKRPPSEVELEMYRRMTKNWSPDLRRLMFPEHHKREESGAKSGG